MLWLLNLLRSPGREKGFLAKRAANSGTASSGAGVRRAAKDIEREYVPAEDDPTASGTAPGDRSEGLAADPAKPSMREVFGPDGFLEKCMKGGFDRTTVTSDYEY